MKAEVYHHEGLEEDQEESDLTVVELTCMNCKDLSSSDSLDCIRYSVYDLGEEASLHRAGPWRLTLTFSHTVKDDG